MTISIGNDHAGLDYKNEVVAFLEEKGFDIINNGTDEPDSVDYPDFVHPVALNIANGTAELGIVMCGSGNGVAMTVNKHADVRAALCWTPEIAKLARQHNDANILSLPIRFLSKEEALEIVKAFFETEFEGGRHQRRVDKISI